MNVQRNNIQRSLSLTPGVSRRTMWGLCDRSKAFQRRALVNSALGLLALLLAFSPALGEPKTTPGAKQPRLAGAYVSREEHPRVFTTRAGLHELANRINTPGNYSARRYDQLAARIATDLATGKAWDAAYTGCNIETYLYAFSYEPQDAQHAAKIHSDLQLDPSTEAPAGAAIVASRLALYAALAEAGASLPPNAPDPKSAADLAKRILLAWADQGFRAANGKFMSSASQFCLGNGKIDAASMTQVGLQVARGVVYSAHAQDLLFYIGALDADQAQRLDAFHAAMYALVLDAHNYALAPGNAWSHDCEHYSNHIATHLTGLLATARLLDDKRKVEAVLRGRDSSYSVALPWVAYFDKAIYGNDDTPNACAPNTGPDGSTSKPAFQTAVVAPGEIDDRYRNSNPLQGIGYPMGALEWLYETAELMRIAGYDAYGYRGSHGQSIEMATRYYACFAKGAGFGKVVTKDNSGNCPDVDQYVGKIVNGVERNILIGAYRFPNDAAITELETEARTSAASGPFALDAVMFGKWRD